MNSVIVNESLHLSHKQTSAFQTKNKHSQRAKKNKTVFLSKLFQITTLKIPDIQTDIQRKFNSILLLQFKILGQCGIQRRCINRAEPKLNKLYCGLVQYLNPINILYMSISSIISPSFPLPSLTHHTISKLEVKLVYSDLTLGVIRNFSILPKVFQVEY